MLKAAVLKLLVNTDPNGRFLEIADNHINFLSNTYLFSPKYLMLS